MTPFRFPINHTIANYKKISYTVYMAWQKLNQYKFKLVRDLTCMIRRSSRSLFLYTMPTLLEGKAICTLHLLPTTTLSSTHLAPLVGAQDMVDHCCVAQNKGSQYYYGGKWRNPPPKCLHKVRRLCHRIVCMPHAATSHRLALALVLSTTIFFPLANEGDNFLLLFHQYYRSISATTSPTVTVTPYQI